MKKFFLGLLALMVSATLFAAPRTMEEAAAIAAQFTNSQQQLSRVHKTPRKAVDMRLAHKVAKPNSEEAALYIFNQNDNGFVIVSGDDNAVTILGYSDEGAFDATNIPANVQFWLDFCAERVAIAQPAAAKPAKKVRKATKVDAISPLLGNIKWDQGTPYNNLCPMDKQTRAYTGCVATAAAQIMKMYNWPETGQGSHTDNWTSDAGKSGTSSADFGATTYDWANMKDSYNGSYTTTQANAVATLMFHVGVSCDMQYGGDESNGSGAYTDDMGNALVNYFRYKNTAKYKSGQSTSQLTSLFNTELEAGRPILMGGSNNSGGHEFVCDGRDAEGLFHINWGWGGTSNGYFALNGLDPDQQGAGGSSAGYNQQIDCVVGIEPDRDPVSVTGVTIDPTALTLKIKETSQLTATVAPADASNKGLAWSTSDASVATVTASGVVKGIAEGTATITATSNDGGKTATCNVTVTDEVALPTLLEVDKAWAEYDDEYEEPWTINVYKNNSELVPYVRFWPDGKQTSKIAGTYTFTGNGGYLWNNMSDPDESKKITTGQLVITCVGSGDGAHGCNTYRVLSYFTCEDDSEYKIDVTLEICAQDTSGTSVDLTDAVGTQPYVVTWEANGETFAENIANNGKLVLPADKPGNCESGKVFVGWSKTEIDETEDAPTFAKNGDAVTANTTYYAVYATAEGGSSVVNDVLTLATTGVTSGSTNYSDWSGKTATSDAVYAGNSAGSNASIQLRSKNSNSGIVTTTSGGKVSKVTVEWNDNTAADRTLDVYGKSSAYSAASDLYGSNAGTKLGSIVKGTSTELAITGDYEFIGVRSNDGAIYLNSITFTWGSANYSGYTTSCGAPAEKYAVTVNTAANGSLASNKAEQAAGKTVTITATPATHYHLATLSVEGATSHTAVAVSGTGNTRTFVMPAEAVTVSGTFALDDKVTVRFIDKGEEISSEQYFIGEAATKPANPSAGCDDYTFVGWHTAELAADNTTAKSWISNFTVSGAQDYYAIYSKTEVGELGANYKKITDLEELTTGNYVVAGNSSYAMKNSIYSNYYLAASSVTASANVIANPANNIIWQITRSGNNVSFYNDAVSQYVCLFQSGTHYNLKLQDNANWFTATVSSGNWSFESNDCDGYYLVHTVYNSTHEFAAKTSSTYTIQLFKQQYNSITYYSSAVSCTATAIENTQVEGEKAIKRIENGQIVIIRGNEKYTIFGQKIQ